MKRLFLFFAIALLALPVYAQDDDSGEDSTLTVITYDSFVIEDDVREAFEEQSGLTLEIVRLNNAGAMVNQAILTRDNPLGDVLYGVDNTFLTRALEADLFVPYESPGLDAIPAQFQLDAEEDRVTPVTFGDVCLNYDVVYFEDNELEVPQDLMALTEPDYAGLLVVQNPATSSPGLAFLLTTIAVFGEEGEYTYLDYWRDLVENDVLVVSGWTEAYYGEFTVGSEEGQYPLVVSYASSPPAEVLFGELEIEDAPSAAIVADETCFRQIEFAGILAGTEREAEARLFIDFLIGETFQEALPTSMFVFPVNENAELPDLFAEMITIPENPVTVAIEDIETNREDWIEAWTEAVLR
ncbi:MAG: thiamine ABC transporter substrate-binding protein [Chloroflexota bacterium]